MDPITPQASVWYQKRKEYSATSCEHIKVKNKEYFNIKIRNS